MTDRAALEGTLPSHLAGRFAAADNLRAARNAITHCPQGHEYTAENTLRHSRTGRRSCRECQRARNRKANAEAVTA